MSPMMYVSSLMYISTGTPADAILGMTSGLLNNRPPSVQEIMYIQSVLLESRDIYKPLNVSKQLMHAENLDVS